MINFTKDNLIAVPKENVTVNTPAIKVNDMVILLDGGTSGPTGATTFYKCAEVGREHVEMPEPVFYAPLTAQSDTAETGQTLTYNTDVTFTTIEGRQCAYFTTNSDTVAITAPATNIPTGNSANSLAIWVYLEDIPYDWNGFLEYGLNRESTGDYRSLAITDGWILFSGAFGVNCSSTTTAETGKWYHLASTYDGTTIKTYVNGVWRGSLDVTLAIGTNGVVNIGAIVLSNRYLADAQIYDVALSAEQVSELYNPTTSTLPAGTWSGYKAFLVEDTENDEKYYQFEETLTTDALTWGKAFTPEVGRVYDAEALIKATLTTNIAIPQDGLVFYAPLAESSTTAETGQAVTTIGTVTYRTVDNRQCAYFDGSSYIQFSDGGGLPYNDAPRTVSVWAKCDTAYPTRQAIFCYGYGAMGSFNSGYNVELRNNTFGIFGENAASNEGYADTEFDASVWHHLLVVHKDSTDYFYIDGVAAGSFSCVRETLQQGIYIGNSTNVNYADGFPFNGYIAATRIYNRVLTDEEIQQLYQEFSA